MGIYIKGMEMPKEAGIYRIEFDQCGNPYLLSENGDLGLWHIISVPDHGRLGDLDALATIHRKGADKGDSAWKFHVTAKAWVDEMPTIIPADIKTMYYPQVDGITPTVIKPKREKTE